MSSFGRRSGPRAAAMALALVTARCDIVDVSQVPLVTTQSSCPETRPIRALIIEVRTPPPGESRCDGCYDGRSTCALQSAPCKCVDIAPTHDASQLAPSTNGFRAEGVGPDGPYCLRLLGLADDERCDCERREVVASLDTLPTEEIVVCAAHSAVGSMESSPEGLRLGCRGGDPAMSQGIRPYAACTGTR